MNKVEYGDIYKFIVSLGIVFISLAVVIPWLFLREPFDLLVDSARIGSLTPEAQSLILLRQSLVMWIIGLLPWVSGSLVTFGIGLIVGGLIFWNKQQKVRDEQERLALEGSRHDVELKKMTFEEKMNKTTLEVQESTRTEHLTTDLPTKTPDQRSEIDSGEIERTDIVMRALQSEISVADSLAQCTRDDFDILRDQKLGSDYYDILLVSKTSQTDLIIEIKYTENKPVSILKTASFSLIGKGTSYQELRRRNVRLVLVIVSRQVSSTEFANQRLFLEHTDEIHPNVWVEVFREDEVKNLRCDQFGFLRG